MQHLRLITDGRKVRQASLSVGSKFSTPAKGHHKSRSFSAGEPGER